MPFIDKKNCSDRPFLDVYSMLGRDGIHLFRKGKGIFGSRLASVVKRAIN